MSAFKNHILKFVDFFHPLVKWILPLQTYRYAFFGVINVLLDFALSNYCYYIAYSGKDITSIQLYFFAFHTHTHTLANFTSACIMIPLGFLIMSYFVFPEASLKKYNQLIRYAIVAISNFFVVVLLTKFFVEICGFVFWTSKSLVTIITVIASYLLQTRFTFVQYDKEQ
ncbi:MAG: GtrA family protein [Chitinophagaceae bacterium]